jgi:hypothetical protein
MNDNMQVMLQRAEANTRIIEQRNGRQQDDEEAGDAGMSRSKYTNYRTKT